MKVIQLYLLNQMIPIISPIDKKILKQELSKDKFLRPTNKAGNEIYIVNAHNSPNVMREIGRLRELSFRSWGGGTGKEIDVDHYDEMKKPYSQLIVWNPDAEEIIGGYRFISGRNATFDESGQPYFTMSHLFKFSQEFIDNYLPYSIELGRAFVQPDYQTTKMGAKSLFALDNLWDGLGALIHQTKNAKYFIGKVTIYDDYNPTARDLLYEYMFHFFPDKDSLIVPKDAIPSNEKSKQMALSLFKEGDASSSYKTLQKAVRNEGETIPPLFNAYIGLTNTMRMFGTVFDPDFGSTYETGIMITMADLLEPKRKRYIDPYLDYLKFVLDQRRKAKHSEKTSGKNEETNLKTEKKKSFRIR